MIQTEGDCFFQHQPSRLEKERAQRVTKNRPMSETFEPLNRKMSGVDGSLEKSNFGLPVCLLWGVALSKQTT